MDRGVTGASSRHRRRTDLSVDVQVARQVGGDEKSVATKGKSHVGKKSKGT